MALGVSRCIMVPMGFLSGLESIYVCKFWHLGVSVGLSLCILVFLGVLKRSFVSASVVLCFSMFLGLSRYGKCF